ncbi:30S ribosomal protein S3 [Candidatus Peribacteria bacterium]|nr:30S ribosomal protein S3 [Candidatus Peribacteria bacterium]
MGKKVSPIALRLGITRTWDSKWFAGRDYKAKMLQDVRLRRFIEKSFAEAEVSSVGIERQGDAVKLIVHCAKPGMVIGRSGEQIKETTQKLRAEYGNHFDIQVKEVRKPDADAQLVAASIASQIERRLPFRRVGKMALQRAQENGAKGMKILISGRLNGADIARQEKMHFGTVPLHTFRADIDYATARAETTYGSIGVKVWIYNGLVFKNDASPQ